jgi:oligoribonuclease
MTDSNPNKNNLIWVDLEMTGLEPERHTILEIATLVTDGFLNIVAEGPNLSIHQPEQVLASMDEWSAKQHEKTGLTSQVRASQVGMAQAEVETLNFLKKYCVEGESPLCGNSVHHDRRFLIKYMPSIHKFLHYRHVDVSTIKGLIVRWYPDQADFDKKKDTHRALADIRESIEELRYYRSRFFRNHDDLARL